MTTLVRPLPLEALKSVPPPRATRKLAFGLALLFVLLPVLLLNVPWRQNVPARGSVTALNPLERTQVIPAPVTGRLVTIEVWEGMRVEVGQVLAQMADQDPQYALRLEQQYELTVEEIRAARALVDVLDLQLLHLEQARDQAVSAAEFQLEMATQKVRAEERDLQAFEADLAQKAADRERKRRLFEQGVASELSFQKAEADALAAEAKVESARATVAQAENDEHAKRAKIQEVISDEQAKIEEVKGKREEALSKVAAAEKKLASAATRLERQRLQVVTAPMSGTILRVHAASSADYLTQGSPLIELVPDAEELAVELWVRGVDAPLITPGRKVRLQFEGWPAVQFAAWPSVAVGTFGGVVRWVDAQGRADGSFRVLVLPDADDAPWPERAYLRQGVRTKGWLLLDTVSLGFEFWRQLNAFPPSIKEAPDTGAKDAAKPDKAEKSDAYEADL